MSDTTKIQKAFDSSAFNSKLVHLHEEDANRFIDTMVDESVVIKQARLVKMNTPQKEIAKIGIGEEVLFPATMGQALADSKKVEASTSTIKLISNEVISVVDIHDMELEDNIEWQSFTQHILDMISKRIANQMDTAALYGEKVTNAVNINGLYDGFVTRALAGWQVIDASDTGLFADRYIDKEKMTKLLKSLPTKYRQSVDALYLHNDIELDWTNLYTTNITTTEWAKNALQFGWVRFTVAPMLWVNRPVVVSWGQTTTTDAITAVWATVIPVTSTTWLTVGKAIKITNAEAGKSAVGTITAVSSGVSVTIDTAVAYEQASGSAVTEITLDGSDVVMTPKNNLIYGIQRNITIESERSATLRKTSFVITMRNDVQVENTEAIAVLTNLATK